MDKSSGRIGRLFDGITPTYDLLNHLLSLSVDVGWRERTLEELGVEGRDRLLDIATGTGDLAILARSKGCPAVGVDLSRGMLKEAARKWERAFGDRYPAVQGDALHMPFPDGSFDKAMVAFGIRNMPDLGAFLEEARRVLREEGRLAVLEFSVPAYPVVRQAYLLYLTRVLPFIGGLQSGDRDAYRYLSESIRAFPSPRSLELLFEQHRFRVVRSTALTLGICHLYVLEKA